MTRSHINREGFYRSGGFGTQQNDDLALAKFDDSDATLDSHEARISTIENGSGISQPFLDLRTQGVVAGNTAKNTTNQTAIKTALAGITVPWTVVKFPPGFVYVDKDSSAANSIGLDGAIHTVPLILDLRGTVLCQYGAGNGGQWCLLEFRNGFNAGCIVLGGALQCSRIDSPDPSSFQHYLMHFVNSVGSSYTGNISVRGTRFGQSQRAGIRFLGESGHLVQHVRLQDIDIDMGISWDGSTPFSANGTGSPKGACFEVQRGSSDIELGNFRLANAHLSVMDWEPTAAAGAGNDRWNIHDGYVDATGSTGVQGCSLGGGSSDVFTTGSIFRNVQVIGANVALLAGSNWLLDRVKIVLNSTPAADVANPNSFGTSPLLYFHDINQDVEIRDCYLVRTSDTGVPTGPLIQINQGSNGNPQRMTINGGYFEQHTAANVIEIDSCPGFTIKGRPTFNCQQASPGTLNVVNIKATGANMDRVSVEGAYVSSANGKLASFLSCTPGNSSGFSIQDVMVRGIQAPGVVTTGVIYDLSSAASGAGSTAPPYPIQSGNDFSGATNDWVASNSATGHVFPITAGDRGGACWLQGTVAPGGVVTASYGSFYVYMNGASSALYLNTSGGTTWTQVTIP